MGELGLEDDADEEDAAAETLDDDVLELALGDDPSLMFNPRRSLIETNVDLLAPLTMEATLSLIATNAGLGSTPALTHNLLFNLYNDAANDVFPGLTPDIPHRNCSDPLYQQIVNNYPYQCPRAEGGMAEGSLTTSAAMGGWTALALVNRIDLAPANGQHCGEQRLVMGRTSGPTRDLVIFEAQIPNPSPTQDPCACLPIAEFWDSLSAINDVGTRAGLLGQAFFFGHPTLSAAGFGPFMAAQNLSIGTGQVRTNNFVDFPWSLRENKLIGWNGIMFPIPVPDVANLHAPLLADASADPRAAACKADFLASIPSLLTNDPNLMALSVSPQCWDGESPNDFNQGNYDTHVDANTSPVFFGQIQAALNTAGSALTPDEVARRANFAGSCIGCHQEASGVNLGGGVTAPQSAFFVHVSEFGTEDCGDGTNCHPISNGLKNSFLPFRQTVMQNFMASCGPSPMMAGPQFTSEPPAEPDGPPAIDDVTGVAVEVQVFDAADATTEDGELDLPALRDLDAASKATGPTIGGVSTSRVH